MFSVGYSAKVIFAESQTQRHSVKIGRRQICLCREPDTRQTLAVGKNFPLPSAGRSAKIGRRQKKFCRVPGTRQNLAVGKGGRRDGGHLPLAFAECPAVRHSAKGFFIYLFLILCRVPCGLALSKLFFLFFCPFFLGPCYSN